MCKYKFILSDLDNKELYNRWRQMRNEMKKCVILRKTDYDKNIWI